MPRLRGGREEENEDTEGHMPRLRGGGREEEDEDTEGQGRKFPHEEVEEDKGEGEDSEK